MATTALTVDGFPFIGDTPEGGRARVLAFDGWLSRTVRRERAPRTGRSGSYSTPAVDDDDEITLKVQIAYPDAASCARERRALKALGGWGEVELVVTDAAGTLAQTVEVDDIAPQVVMDRLLQVTVVMTGGDSVAHVVDPTTVAVPAGATVNVPSDGTAAADLRATVTSAGTVQLTAGGLTLTTSRLPVGAVIDTASCTVTGPDGADLYGAVAAAAQWPALPAGGGPVTQGGTASLDITYRDTYA